MFSQQARNLDEINKLIGSLEGSCIENEPWLKDVAGEINKSYRKARSDIRDNANFWFYSQYCECLSYHYYNLGLTHYKLFYDNKIDLESVIVCLKKCLEEIEKIDKGNSEIDSLKSNANNFLEVVNGIYEKQTKKFTEDNLLRNAQQCIILGMIEDCRAFLKQVKGCNEEKKLLEQQIKSIQLLRAINTIEDALTVSEIKSTVVTAEYSDCLSRVYRLPRNVSLSERYKRTAQHLRKSRSRKKDIRTSQQRNKDNLERIVEEGVKKYGNDIKTIIYEIESVMTLDDIDRSNIEKKYIEYCLELSLEEMKECLEDLVANKDNEIISNTLKSLNKVISLNEIPSPFNTLKYYQLLIRHQKLVSEASKETFVSEFKEKCLEQKGLYYEFFEEELTFLEAFVDFLSSKNLSLVRAQLQRFCDGDLTSKELLEKIMSLKVNTYGEELRVLQEIVERFKKEEDLFLTDKIKEAIEAYIKPVEPRITIANNRLVVEVIGKNLVISEILLQLNDVILRNPEIEEVRFGGGDIIHIDANIEKDIWHGKNITVFTKRIKVHNEIVWNVSGKDGEAYLTSAGTCENGEGKQGADGHPGESGGNVWILAEEMENSEKFTVISHGGKGGRGQDGGDGKNGKNGQGIEKKHFNERFPPVATFLSLPISLGENGEEKKSDVGGLTLPESYRRTYIRKTMENIKKDANKIEIAWYSNIRGAGTNGDVIEKIIKDAKSIKLLSENGRNDGTPIFTGNIFVKAMTDQGNEITFSFEHGGFSFTTSQAFLLYKGSKGKQGEKGGEYGLGGPGGYGGNIIIDNPIGNRKVVKSIKNGENGKDGDSGSRGEPGRDGWDMGYMDYSISIKVLGIEWPKVYDDQNNKIKLRYYHGSQGRIYCPYREFRGNHCKYAQFEFSEVKDVQEKKCEEKVSTRQNSERKCQTRATRKKAILREEVLASYSSLLQNTLRNTLIKNARSELEEIRNIQIINQSKEQQKTLDTQVKIGHDTAFTGKNQHTTFDTISDKQYDGHVTDDSDSDLFEEYKLEKIEKQKRSQIKTEKDMSNIRDNKDCLESAKTHVDRAEDSNKCFLESAYVEQVKSNKSKRK